MPLSGVNRMKLSALTPKKKKGTALRSALGSTFGTNMTKKTFKAGIIKAAKAKSNAPTSKSKPRSSRS